MNYKYWKDQEKHIEEVFEKPDCDNEFNSNMAAEWQRQDIEAFLGNCKVVKYQSKYYVVVCK